MKRLGIIGFGKVGAEHHKVFRSLNCEVVCSANRSERGRALASQAGIPKVYSSYEVMLDSESLDGVICCVTETNLFGVAKDLLNRRMPFLLEKPPGTSLQEVKTLHELSLAQQTPVMVGLNRRHYSVLLQAIELAGGYDKITAVNVEWSEQLDLFTRRGFGDDEIGKMVFGYSLHGLDLLTFLAGNLDSASILGRSLGDPFRWQMSLQAMSDRGVLANFTSSWDSPIRWRLSFDTENRHFVFAPLESCTVTTYSQEKTNGKRKWVTHQIEPTSDDVLFKPGFLRQGQSFLKLLAGEPQPEYDLASTFPAMRLAQTLTDRCLGV